MTRHEYDELAKQARTEVYGETAEILRVCNLAGVPINKVLDYLDKGMNAGAVARELIGQGGHDLRSQLANSEGVPADRRNPLLVDAENRRKAAVEAMATEAPGKYRQ